MARDDWKEIPDNLLKRVIAAESTGVVPPEEWLPWMKDGGTTALWAYQTTDEDTEGVLRWIRAGPSSGPAWKVYEFLVAKTSDGRGMMAGPYKDVNESHGHYANLLDPWPIRDPST